MKRSHDETSAPPSLSINTGQKHSHYSSDSPIGLSHVVNSMPVGVRQHSPKRTRAKKASGSSSPASGASPGPTSAPAPAPARSAPASVMPPSLQHALPLFTDASGRVMTRIPTISRKVRACAACKKQKIRCDFENGDTCVRCKKMKLECVVNRSLQTILDEDVEWKHRMREDMVQMQRAMADVLARLHLPPLSSYSSVVPPSLTRTSSEPPISSGPPQGQPSPLTISTSHSHSQCHSTLRFPDSPASMKMDDDYSRGGTPTPEDDRGGHMHSPLPGLGYVRNGQHPSPWQPYHQAQHHHSHSHHHSSSRDNYSHHSPSGHHTPSTPTHPGTPSATAAEVALYASSQASSPESMHRSGGGGGGGHSSDPVYDVNGQFYPVGVFESPFSSPQLRY
jgi:hypothetical protein